MNSGYSAACLLLKSRFVEANVRQYNHKICRGRLLPPMTYQEPMSIMTSIIYLTSLQIIKNDFAEPIPYPPISPRQLSWQIKLLQKHFILFQFPFLPLSTREQKKTPSASKCCSPFTPTNAHICKFQIAYSLLWSESALALASYLLQFSMTSLKNGHLVVIEKNLS